MLLALGFSINVLTMFGMVLVIGIVIVVVACLQALFGIDLLGHLHSIGR